MFIEYCDLCGKVIKEPDGYQLEMDNLYYGHKNEDKSFYFESICEDCGKKIVDFLDDLKINQKSNKEIIVKTVLLNAEK